LISTRTSRQFTRPTRELPLWLDALQAFLVLTGAAFALIGSCSLARLSDFAKHLHGPTKGTTLGVGCVLIASSLSFSVPGDTGMPE
jgi:multicomponent K+:H+ antiporter subunit G